MRLIRSDEDFHDLMCNTSFYRRNSSATKNTENWGGICGIAEEVIGVLLDGRRIQGVLFSKEYAKQRKREIEEEKKELLKEIGIIRAYLAVTT